MRRRRSGFTLIELLVVFAIVAVLIGMLLPSVQKIRESAVKAESQNNLHQQVIALHRANDTYNLLPPMYGTYPKQNPGNGFGSIYFHLLPFLEQRPLFDSTLNPQSNYYESWYSAANGKPIKVYLNPGDSTADEYTQVGGHAACGYAANMQVFGSTAV